MAIRNRETIKQIVVEEKKLVETIGKLLSGEIEFEKAGVLVM